MNTVALSLASTTSHAATSTPYVYPADPNRSRLIRIVATCAVRVAYGATVGEGDFPIPANEASILDLGAGQTLAIVKGTGEADATVWLSEIKRV